MTTQMLIQTSDKGLRACSTRNIESSDPKAVVDHLKKGGLTGGISISFAVNKATGEVVEILKKGYICQRDIKPLVAGGFSEWFYSWAFAGKTFQLDDGSQVTLSRTIDLVPQRHVERYRGLIG